MGSSDSSFSQSEVRIGHSLNKEEEEFLARRRKTVQQSLQKLHRCSARNEMNVYEAFGGRRRVKLCILQSLDQLSENEVPNIALLGSGGGERAMVGLLGSLDQLQKTGLLDCVLYLSGVSGSTWCMASLYQEPDWSTKLETVKDKIIQRLSGPAVSWGDAVSKLNKYYFGKDFYCSTDIWAAMVVTKYVKEVDEHTVSDQWNQQSKDPFPIYTVIDKQCKQNKDTENTWFEFTPYEAGYSLTGAFVETSSFGSKFENGRKIKNQPEMDMLYLQALCGSAIADEDENEKFIWEKIKEFSGLKSQLDHLDSSLIHSFRDPIRILFGNPITKLFGDPITNLFENPITNLFKPLTVVGRQNQWIWGRNYNFLYDMKDAAVPAALLKSETRDYEDAGLLLNSPYFSVLRKERDIDLIISLDFSDGDPFMTVIKAAEMCKKLNIPFPEVNIPDEDIKKPKDFYVFRGQNTPTVIHIALFNVDNCGDDIEQWRKKYATFQDSYSAEMITDLMEVAGQNITNNREKLVEEIFVVTSKRKFKVRNESFANFL